MLRWLAMGACVAALTACATAHPEAPAQCAQVDGIDSAAPLGRVVCEAQSLGGERNKAAARADGDGAHARAVAGSLELFDNGKPGDYIPSDNNSAAAHATHGGGALARSGVNKQGKKGVGGNSAVARADRPRAFADASAANGSNNTATSIAEGCIGAPGEACAFSVAGNGDGNTATAESLGKGSNAQAGALDGDRNTAVATGRDGGRAFSNAQGRDRNTAHAVATGDNAFATAQSSDGDGLALSRATDSNSAANATVQKGGVAGAFADKGASATASATGSGFTATAFASGEGTSATAYHDADAATGSCSGPGVAFAMTGDKVHCIQGF